MISLPVWLSRIRVENVRMSALPRLLSIDCGRMTADSVVWLDERATSH
jgi:hypothetical protein